MKMTRAFLPSPSHRPSHRQAAPVALAALLLAAPITGCTPIEPDSDNGSGAQASGGHPGSGGKGAATNNGGSQGSSGGQPGGSGGTMAGGTMGSNPSGAGGAGGANPGASGGGSGDAGPAGTGGAGDAATVDPNAPPQDISAWKAHRDVILNTSATGAGIMTALANYPVPVKLTKDTFDFTKTKPDGSDIRFTKPDGTLLPHEIELWDATNQVAALWVKTSLEPNNTTQKIVMHWGNATAPNTSDGKAVFPPAENWVAAWHLGDDAATAQDGFKDATGVNHGTGHNLEKGAARPGPMGLATNLDHLKKQGVKVVENRKNFDLARDITFEIWAFVRSFGYNKGYESYMTKGDESWRYMRSGTTALTEICSDGQNPACVFSKSSVQFGKWYHFAGVHQGGRAVRLYINGKREGAGNAGSDHGSFGDHAVTLGFSLHKGVEQRFMDMIIDESRFIKEAKTDDWIKLDYESLREGSTFVTFGPVVGG
jgi:hypothetical protein